MTISETIAKSLINIDFGKLSESVVSDRLLGFLRQNNLEYFLPEIIANLKKHSKIGTGKQALVYASHELSSAQIAGIKKRFAIPDTIIPEIILDEGLLGGMIVLWDGKIFDASISNSVRQLAQVLDN